MLKQQQPSIFFIGLGNMGNPMVANLLKSGYSVTVFDVTKAKAENLLALGAKWSSDLTGGLDQSDVVITSLPGPDQVSDVYFGDDGILAHAQPELTLIDTTTSSVELAIKIEKESKHRKLRFIEAPVTNAIDGAERGELAFFIGGEQECFLEHKPIFEVLGTDFFFTGKPGNGATTKLITNLLWFINAAAIGEGLMIGAKADIPLETVAGAIRTSAGNSWVAEHDISSIFAGHYDPSFSLDLCCKDLRLVHEIADAQGLSLTLGSVARSMFEEAKEKYGADAPELSVARLVEEKMGVLLRPQMPAAEELESSRPNNSDTSANPSRSRQSKLMAEAHKHMPQGVAENYRYWGDERTVFVDRAKGYEIFDADGKRYVDFRLGYGPIILGYGDPRIDQAVVSQIQRGGTLTGFATALDTEVVKQIKALCSQVEKVRFANSGTEAVMGAIRTARGHTGRDRVATFEGGFHGLFDEMMWKSDIENWSSKDVPPAIIPFGGGIPDKTRDLVDQLPLNCFEALENHFSTHGQQLACVVLEPIIGNCGSISATQEWLQRLRDLCTQHGTLLVIDEVKTGFRVAKGGAQQRYGIYADLSTYAKAMGNGYAVAAFGGRADVMDSVGSNQGGVVHGGTYTGNLVGLAAANATLDILTNTDALKTIDRAGDAIQEVLGRVFNTAGVEHRFAGPPAMFGIHFTETVPANYRDWKQTDSQLYEAFAWNLIDAGVMLEPDSREPWFICEAHQHMDLGWLEDVATQAMKSAQRG